MIVGTQKGDLVATLERAIATPKDERTFYMGHGCNCFVTQGSGIAGQLRRFPEIFQADVLNARSGDPLKLGTVSSASFGDDIDANSAVVFNMYTQFSMGTNERHVEYAAVAQAVSDVCEEISAKQMNDVLYLPMIGAGLAGGDWAILYEVIDRASGGQRVIIVDFEPNTIIDW
ncbi:phosphatase [Vibrio phage F86]